LPDTYHSAGHGRGTATLKFYEGRDILLAATAARRIRVCIANPPLVPDAAAEKR